MKRKSADKVREEINTELTKDIADQLGNRAVRYNQTAGYDSAENLAQIMGRRLVWKEIVRDIVPKGGGLGGILAVLKRRFAPLRKVVQVAAGEPPSVARFVRVAQAVSETILRSAQHQDSLFELSGSFRRAFDLLAERPKTIRRMRSEQDLLLTDAEKRRVLKGACALLNTIVACGGDCYARQASGAELFAQPPRFDQVAARFAGAKAEETFFHQVRKGLWAYDGAAFREIRRHVGVINSPCYDPEDIEEELSELLRLNLPLWLKTAHGDALLTLVLSAMAAGGDDPDKVAASADEAIRALMLDMVRSSMERVSELTARRREEIAQAERRNERRKKAALKRMTPLTGRNVAAVKEVEAARAKLLDQIFEFDLDCIRQKDRLDEEERLVRRQLEALPPPRPKALPPPPYRGSEKHHSKFYGQTLGQKIGHMITVGLDGVTFTCPTWIGQKKAERSYKISGEKQLQFLDLLLAAYRKDAGAWVSPPDKSCVWQASYFKRKDARLFLDDGHIVSEQTENGKYTGRIRLSVPGVPKRR